jgi:hypothetical protein
MFLFSTELIGDGVRRFLDAHREAMVCAVFRRSFYLEATDGDMVCIGPSAMGAGPINMICDLPDGMDWEASGLRLDSRAAIGSDRIVVAGHYEFDFNATQVWRPAALPKNRTTTSLTEGLKALDTAASEYDLNEGLAALVRIDGQPMEAARTGFDSLSQWLNGLGEPPAAVAPLIGLGPGLTPSGDDLIGGAMVALRLFGKKEAADRFAEWALPLARDNTGKISLAHLKQAALGQGADALHRAINAIAEGNASALGPCLRDIDAIGHSSGWDALAGAVAVMRRISPQ